MNPRYKRILWTVIGINGTMFLTEMMAGRVTVQSELGGAGFRVVLPKM